MNPKALTSLGVLGTAMFLLGGTTANLQAAPLVHDSEYYILEAQNKDKWAADDQAVDAKLAAFKAKNGANHLTSFTS